MQDRISIAVSFAQGLGFIARAPELPACGISALSINRLRNLVSRALPNRPFTLALNAKARREYSTRMALASARRLMSPVAPRV